MACLTLDFHVNQGYQLLRSVAAEATGFCRVSRYMHEREREITMLLPANKSDRICQ